MSDKGLSSDVLKDRMTRRELIQRIALYSASAAGLLFGLTWVFYLMPKLFPSPNKLFTAGDPGEFGVGSETDFGEKKVLLYRDENGFYAISRVCTHLGCTVNIVDLATHYFQCPCHGSRYNKFGEVVQGPAPKTLPRWNVQKSPSGKLQIDTGKEVTTDFRFPA